MSSMTDLRDLCIQMKRLQDEIDQLDAQDKILKAELDDLRLKRIPELMDQLEVKNATFEGIGRVQLASDLYCSTKAGQKDVAMQWLRDLGLDNMISETYNATSMKALVRRLIVDGSEIPECLSVTPFTRASIVKA